MKKPKKEPRTPGYMYKEGDIVWVFDENSKGRITRITVLPFNAPFGFEEPYWLWIDVYVFELQEYLVQDVEEICLLSDLSELERAIFGID